MTQATIDFIGFSFLLKIAIAWGILTTVISLAIGIWQRLTGQETGWEASVRNRRAAIVRHYPDSAA